MRWLAKQPTATKALLLICLGCLLAGVSFWTILAILGPSPSQGQQRAQALITALEQYKQDHGYYPAHLNDLRPTYLATIPRPHANRPYIYSACPDGKVYIIDFEPRLSTPLTPHTWGYTNETGRWKCVEGSYPAYLNEIPCFGYTSKPNTSPYECK